eukprot:TRINITY_DN19786_c0_g2_i2.p1 TRINITY_DN19786_c0_g2~~TRINITY_DN19786_c0_g2_i2.p1  ORF type:complete len:244 (-),score=36.95 TRINITY_DN19786_c0_g2_i2:83-814(-)
MEFVWKAYLAEFLGTFLFQLVGGSVLNVDTSERQMISAALNGIGLATCIFLTANISGGHLNPVVSLGMMIQGSLSALDFPFYVFSQIAGAICGAGLLKWFLPNEAYLLCASINNFGMAYVAELIFTFFLVSMVLSCCASEEGGHGSLSPLAIGFVQFVCSLSVGGISGAYINPARLIGPSAVYKCKSWRGWILLFAQLPAGALAGLYGILMYGLGKNYGEREEGEAYQKVGMQLGEAREEEAA